jgi:hypothetical protein
MKEHGLIISEAEARAALKRWRYREHWYRDQLGGIWLIPGRHRRNCLCRKCDDRRLVKLLKFDQPTAREWIELVTGTTLVCSICDNPIPDSRLGFDRAKVWAKAKLYKKYKKQATRDAIWLFYHRREAINFPDKCSFECEKKEQIWLRKSKQLLKEVRMYLKSR